MPPEIDQDYIELVAKPREEGDPIFGIVRKAVQENDGCRHHQFLTNPSPAGTDGENFSNARKLMIA